MSLITSSSQNRNKTFALPPCFCFTNRRK